MVGKTLALTSGGLEVKPPKEERGLHLVYWERNGELLKNNLAQQILNQIRTQEPIKEWTGKKERYGHYIYKAYVLEGVDGIIIVAEWVPEPGYGWEEYKIYILRF